MNEYALVEEFSDAIEDIACDLADIGYPGLANLYRHRVSEVFKAYRPNERELNAANMTDALAGIEAAAKRCLKMARRPRRL